MPDDLEQLLSDIRKTINDNSQFIKKLRDDSLDETLDRMEEDAGEQPAAEDFEEL